MLKRTNDILQRISSVLYFSSSSFCRVLISNLVRKKYKLILISARWKRYCNRAKWNLSFFSSMEKSKWAVFKCMGDPSPLKLDFSWPILRIPPPLWGRQIWKPLIFQYYRMRIPRVELFVEPPILKLYSFVKICGTRSYIWMRSDDSRRQRKPFSLNFEWWRPVDQINSFDCSRR